MKRKVLALLITGALLAGVLSGCGGGGTPSTAGTETAGEGDSSGTGEAQISGDEEVSDDEVVELEMWVTNNGYLPVEKDGVVYNFYKDLLGVGITEPYVEWNGGQTYGEQLNLRIAAGEMPDIVQPVNGIETGLAKEGALLDLTDYLPQYAPHLWDYISENTWDVIKSYDPTGEGRIYMIPLPVDFTPHGAMIRKDWLDNLGLEMPTTQEELVEVLRAFKTQDPNGNGVADEIPTGGRAEARWMDYLFAMYGIAMWEGYPEWDIFDGELTYSAVTPNMRDALEFISGLYQEGLLDVETLINDKAAWDGKMNAGQVGVFYQWPERSYMYAADIYNATGIQSDLVVMPVISAEGYEGFYTKKPTAGIGTILKATDDENRIKAMLTVVDAYGNADLRDTLLLGPEGMHCARDEEGVLKKLPEDKTTQEHLVVDPSGVCSNAESVIKQLELNSTEDTKWAIDRAIQNVKDVQQYGKVIAGDGIPSSIYDGYDDIENRTLYVEYASKIIAGEWPIEKFDEFVEKWYAQGGTEVTKAAREWYAVKNG